MMTVTPPKRVRHRGPRPRAVSALRLVSAAYLAEQWVRLTFDRAVDADGIDVAAVTLDDQVLGAVYRGTGAATMVAPRTVQVPLQAFAMSGGTARLLTATAGNGLVAADDGGPWAGVSNLALPFP